MPKIKNILIFVAIGVALVLVYIFFLKPAPEQAGLVSSTPDATPAAGSTTTTGVSVSTEDFLTLLLSVKNIKLDSSIFSDAAFNSLRDSSIVLTPDGTEGRPNPFAQFGNDSGSSSTSSSTSPSATLPPTSPVTPVIPVIPSTPITPPITSIPKISYISPTSVTQGAIVSVYGSNLNLKNTQFFELVDTNNSNATTYYFSINALPLADGTKATFKITPSSQTSINPGTYKLSISEIGKANSNSVLLTITSN